MSPWFAMVSSWAALTGLTRHGCNKGALDPFAPIALLQILRRARGAQPSQRRQGAKVQSRVTGDGLTRQLLDLIDQRRRQFLHGFEMLGVIVAQFVKACRQIVQGIQRGQRVRQGFNPLQLLGVIIL
jgi:hypothetical protein